MKHFVQVKFWEFQMTPKKLGISIFFFLTTFSKFAFWSSYFSKFSNWPQNIFKKLQIDPKIFKKLQSDPSIFSKIKNWPLKFYKFINWPLFFNFQSWPKNNNNEIIYYSTQTKIFKNEGNSIESFELLRILISLKFQISSSKHTLRVIWYIWLNQ